MAHVQLPEQDDVLLCRQGWEAGQSHLGLWGGGSGVPLGAQCNAAPHLFSRGKGTCPGFSCQGSNTCRIGGYFKMSIEVFLINLGDESPKKLAQTGKVGSEQRDFLHRG